MVVPDLNNFFLHLLLIGQASRDEAATKKNNDLHKKIAEQDIKYQKRLKEVQKQKRLELQMKVDAYEKKRNNAQMFMERKNKEID